MSNDLIPKQILASGTILAASDNTLASSKQAGCVAARTGAGVYTLTKDPGVPGPTQWPAANQLLVKTQSRTALAIITAVRTSNTVLTLNCVTVAAGNAALETDLSFEVADLEAAT